jgi:ribonuclease BN (tRNA processing enzyme)
MFHSLMVGVLAAFAALAIPINVAAQSCTGNPVTVQILGSGGPRINPDRASASYLLWIGSQAKVLVDTGGGAYLRFGQSRAQLSDLSLIAISHLHPDHVADLPAILWTSTTIRKEPLPIVGPSGTEGMTDFQTFLNRLFGADSGAFQVLRNTLGASPAPASSGGVRLEVSVADAKKPEATTVFDKDGLTVTAFGIPHGPFPTLAYRVQTRGVSIVFSSDQTGTNPKFVDFAKGANVLIMHMAIAAGTKNPLHASPEVVGRVAQEAGVGRLILSHIGVFDLDAAVAEVKQAYTGPLTVGADLQCTSVQ